MPGTMRRVAGRPLSGGVAVGRAVCIAGRQVEVYRFPLAEGDVAAELERVDQAAARVADELEALAVRADRELGPELAAIFAAHRMLAEDRTFLGQIRERIADERVNAEWAVRETSEALEKRFAGFDDDALRERGQDLRDVAEHLQRALGGIAHHELSEIEGDVVIVADDLTPSEAVRLGRQNVVAFALEGGGRTSHTTIIARSLHIPLVGGLTGVLAMVTDEDPVVVDGDEGLVVLHPTAEVLAEYGERRRDQARRAIEIAPSRALHSVTADGRPVDLLANIDLPEEIDDAVACGAQGVGLYRSEFLYIEKSPELPTEDEHVALYRGLLERMAPHPVTIRTYDLGGRKLARELTEVREANPVLGLRGIRLTLGRRDLFRTQLRALARAGRHGDLRILLPLVSAIDEVRDFRRFLEEVMEELEAEGVPYAADYRLGVMIEVPAAALVADAMAREAEFLSIGTNDLIQYSMAVDRNNDRVAHLYRGNHPAILRLIRMTVEAGRRAEVPVSLCGEMAANPASLPLLVGLGLTSLSLMPRSIPEVKRRVRALSAGDCEALAVRCLELQSADEVAAALAEATPGQHVDA